MLAILNYLNAHYLPIFQPILMILVSKFMFYKALSYKTYLLLGLLSPLMYFPLREFCVCLCFVMHYVVSIILKRKRKLVSCFAI